MFTAKLIATLIGFGILRLLFREKRNHQWEEEANVTSLLDIEVEAETDLDCSQESMPKVLSELASLFQKGFTAKEAQALLDRSLRARVNEQFEVSYSVPWKDGISTLRMAVFRDDIESLIIYFKGPTSLIQHIEDQIDHFNSEDE